jgi:hypothetical protein
MPHKNKFITILKIHSTFSKLGLAAEEVRSLSVGSNSNFLAVFGAPS